MAVMLIVGMAWMVLAVAVALVIGRAIRVADQRQVSGIPERLPVVAFQVDAQLRLPNLPSIRSGRQLA